MKASPPISLCLSSVSGKLYRKKVENCILLRTCKKVSKLIQYKWVYLEFSLVERRFLKYSSSDWPTSPHVLIQSMRTSFCICRLINRQNTGYNYQIWAMSAGNRSTGVILPDRSFHFPPFFSLLMAAFRGRNQRFIMECTLLWTITGYRPQCKVPSKVSQNSA
mgnify:CR=1 FL=1